MNLGALLRPLQRDLGLRCSPLLSQKVASADETEELPVFQVHHLSTELFILVMSAAAGLVLAVLAPGRVGE